MISPADARRLDAQDPLRARRDLFALPQGVIYLNGNSLGPPTRATLARLRRTAETEWAEGLVGSWNDAGWIDLAARCGARIAKIIGAAPADVIVADSVTVNIFKLAAALKAAEPDLALAVRRSEFPTDVYAVDGLAQLTGAPVIDLDAAPHGRFIRIVSAVDYRTGAPADIDAAEAETAAAGGAIIWDLSHAAGVLDLRLADRGVRFAVGCGYKFLNGGPGAPAFLYARGDAAAALRPPLAGWMGHAAPFAFSPDYAPAAGAQRFAAGTPPILSLSALDEALAAFEGAAPQDLHAKAQSLGDLFLACIEGLGLPSISPPAGRPRGAQVSLVHSGAYPLSQALKAQGVIVDFRPPDILRFGFSPLILSHSEVAQAAAVLADILRSGEWRQPQHQIRRMVT